MHEFISNDTKSNSSFLSSFKVMHIFCSSRGLNATFQISDVQREGVKSYKHQICARMIKESRMKDKYLFYLLYYTHKFSIILYFSKMKTSHFQFYIFLELLPIGSCRHIYFQDVIWTF